MGDPIYTERLDLVPMTPEFLRASLAGDRERAQELLGMRVPMEWPERPETLERRLRQLEEDPSLQPWLLRAIGLRDEGQMVGYIGFHSKPGEEYLRQLSPGGVEFGYTVSRDFRRRGYAREACEALMQWASANHGVTRFVVSISPSNESSLRLASQLGFTKIGSHVDETDGPEDILERQLHNA